MTLKLAISTLLSLTLIAVVIGCGGAADLGEPHGSDRMAAKDLGEPPDSDRMAAKDLGEPYSADDLMAAYLDSPDDYEADWLNHRINVSGTVKEISRAGEVHLSTSFDGEEVILVGLADALLDETNAGELVEFACAIGVYSRGAIEMTGCGPAEYGGEAETAGDDSSAFFPRKEYGGAADLGEPYSADELMAAYLDSADDYDADWLNHRVNVSGTVKEVSRAREVHLSTSFDGEDVVLVGLADEYLDEIAEGDLVEFACAIGVYSRGAIEMTGCGPAERGGEAETADDDSSALFPRAEYGGAADLGEPYSADELMAAYLDSPDDYEADWLNHRVNVSGTVKEVSRAREVHLSTSFDGEDVVLVGLADEYLDEIAEGELVEFACAIGVYSRGAIEMTGCGPAEYGGEAETAGDDSSAFFPRKEYGGAADLGEPYSADELMAAYLDSPDDYEADWLNHRVNVSGTVKEVSRAGEVHLSTSFDGEDVVLVGLADEYLDGIAEGDLVEFACAIGVYSRGAIEMTGCGPAEYGGEAETAGDDSSTLFPRAEYGGAADLGEPYSADELMAAYLDSPDDYEADWLNHRINVVGTVKEVSRAGEVYLSTSFDGEEIILVGLADALLNETNAGDLVEFACAIGEYSRGAIEMAGCGPAEHGGDGSSASSTRE